MAGHGQGGNMDGILMRKIIQLISLVTILLFLVVPSFARIGFFMVGASSVVWFSDTFTGTAGDDLTSNHAPEIVDGVANTAINVWDSGASTYKIATTGSGVTNDPGLEADIAPDNTATADVARTESGVTTGWTNGSIPMDTVDSVTEGTEPNGTFSMHLVAGDNGDRVYTTVSTTVGLLHKLTIIANHNVGTSNARVNIGTAEDSTTNGFFNIVAGGFFSYNLYFTPTTATTYVTIKENGAANDTELWVDVLEVKPITLNEMFATDDLGITQGIFDVDITIPATMDGSSGLVIASDSVSSPANFIDIYYNRETAKIELWKNVAGTYTSLINTTATYSAGATLRATLTISGSDLLVDVEYDGNTIGTQQTISNAGIVGNTRHGTMSTDTDNVLENFVVTIP